MSCAELMYHQNLSSGFPYHHPHHQRSIADVYYSNYNSASAACSDYDAQVSGVTQVYVWAVISNGRLGMAGDVG